MKRLTLITGGARCGKSRYALSLLEPYARKAFIATAEALDDEMRDRIAAHQAERGAGFVTIEAPVELAHALRSLPSGVEAGVVDCLTVWLGNLLHVFGEDDDAIGAQLEALIERLRTPPVDLVIVTNEVGWGLVPENPLGRRFRDLAGRLNQQVAAVAHEVVLMVSGLPLHLKRSLP